jgi:hypothetical protein
LFMLRPVRTPELPPTLHGVWTTTHPDFQARELAFVDSRIQFRNGADAAVTQYPIVAMTSRVLGDTTQLGLTYQTADGDVDLQARLVNGATPKLLFAHPNDLIWTRRTP